MKNKSAIIAAILTAVPIWHSLAVPVYRYEFASYGGIRPQGTEGSAYIDFRTPSTPGLVDRFSPSIPLDEAIADVQFRGSGAYGASVLPEFGGPKADIPAPIFRGLHGLEYDGGITWSPDFGVQGNWIIYAFAWPQYTNFRLSGPVIYSFYPLEYFPNESTYVGGFRFTGIVDNPAVPEIAVPDAGSTVMLFGMAIAALGAIRQKLAI